MNISDKKKNKNTDFLGKSKRFLQAIDYWRSYYNYTIYHSSLHS